MIIKKTRLFLYHLGLTVLLAALTIPAANGLSLFNRSNKAPAESPPVDQPHLVQDFAYGEFLYDYYQNRFFTSITRLLVAKEQKLFKHQPEHADILLGSLCVAYGLLNDAEEIFYRLIDTNTSEETRNKAWFHIATLKYKQGNFFKAREILDTKLINPGQSIQAERKIIQSLILLQNKEFEAAGALLQTLPKKRRIDTYSKYNLAVAFAGLGNEALSTEQFDEVLTYSLDKQRDLYGTSGTELDETLALKDRAALALGINFLHSKKYLEAQQAFREIRLDGPYSNPALLGLGWANFHNGEKNKAFTPWLELSRRTPADPAVQEVYLHIPYAYENLGALQDALDGYVKAYKIYNSQEIALNKAILRIQKDDWIDQLSPKPDFKDDPLDVIPPFTPPESFETFYLYEFFASNKFNEGYRNYRELQRLKQLTLKWLSIKPIYENMISVNRERLIQVAGKAAAAMQAAEGDRSASIKKLANINEQLALATSGAQLSVTASAEEKQILQRLDRAQARLQTIPQSQEASKLQDRIKLYRGLLQWDWVQSQSQRNWQALRGSLQLERELKTLEQGINRIATAQNSAAKRYDGFETRFEELGVHLEELLVRLDTALLDHQSYLQNIGVSIMKTNLSHINRLKAEALLASSRLKDLSYVAEREKELNARPNTTHQGSQTQDDPSSNDQNNKNNRFKPGADQPWYKFWR